jgi:hypothetical protein
MTSTNQLLYILCSVQRAMLGNVTPNLRAVYVMTDNEATFQVVFYYDQPLSKDEEELASLTDTEVISTFPSPVYSTDYKVQVLPFASCKLFFQRRGEETERRKG